MRSLHLLLALALASCSIRVTAADVDFEFDSELFEQAEDGQPNPFRISVVEEMRSYDHPIYEGLWPMTREAFRGDRRIIPKNFDVTLPKLPTAQPQFFEPIRMVLPSMPIAANLAVPVINFAGPSYDHPLYEGLWSMTLAAFRGSDVEKDREVFGFSIAMNN